MVDGASSKSIIIDLGAPPSRINVTLNFALKNRNGTLVIGLNEPYDGFVAGEVGAGL